MSPAVPSRGAADPIERVTREDESVARRGRAGRGRREGDLATPRSAALCRPRPGRRRAAGSSTPAARLQRRRSRSATRRAGRVEAVGAVSSRSGCVPVNDPPVARERPRDQRSAECRSRSTCSPTTPTPTAIRSRFSPFPISTSAEHGSWAGAYAGSTAGVRRRRIVPLHGRRSDRAAGQVPSSRYGSRSPRRLHRPAPSEQQQPDEAAAPAPAPLRRRPRRRAPAAAAPPPVAAPAEGSGSTELPVPEGGTVLVDVLANDTDPDGGALSIVSVGAPARGVARRVGDRVQFTAPSDYVGSVTFPYTIADSQGATDSATVSVTVLLVNTSAVVHGRPRSDRCPRTRGLQSVPGWAREHRSRGRRAKRARPSRSSSPSTTRPLRRAAPDRRRTGNAHLHAGSGCARLGDRDRSRAGRRRHRQRRQRHERAADVHDHGRRPSTIRRSRRRRRRRRRGRPAGVTFDVLANDTDTDAGDTLSVSALTSPVADGTLTDNGGGSFTYVPDSDFAGSETFSYTASDGNGGTSTAVVTLTVASQPDAPDGCR